MRQTKRFCAPLRRFPFCTFDIAGLSWDMQFTLLMRSYYSLAYYKIYIYYYLIYTPMYIHRERERAIDLARERECGWRASRTHLADGVNKIGFIMLMFRDATRSVTRQVPRIMQTNVRVIMCECVFFLAHFRALFLMNTVTRKIMMCMLSTCVMMSFCRSTYARRVGFICSHLCVYNTSKVT